MTAPHRILVDFAKRKGKVPFPCFYCANRNINIEEITDEHNIISEFGTEDNVPQTCLAGQHGPSEYADCRHAMYVDLKHHRMFANDIFDFLTREYMMEVLTTIQYGENVTRHNIIMRWRKGYHTREIRLNELYDAGYIDMFYNNDNEETYVLTSRGNELANAVSDMIERYIEIKEIPDALDFEIPRMVFEYIRSNSNCTKKQIYDHFGEDGGYDTTIPFAVEDLTRSGYIEPTYDEGFEEIHYDTTYKGVLRWQRRDRGC